MRIGISILTREGHNLWSNGIDQNVYHLACLLRSLPFIEKVVLLDCGILGKAPDYAGELGSQFEIIPLSEVQDSIDIAIEVSGVLDAEWTARFRARGGKVVFHICGHPYSALVEPTTFNRSSGFGRADRCDEIWMLPKDALFGTMVQAIYRCPVLSVPYLWAPVFLEMNAALARKEVGEFGYKPGSLVAGHVQPAIFEPNISAMKTGIIPFLICEQMERFDANIIKSVHFMNSAQFAAHPTFMSLVGHSDLYKAEKVLLSNRDYFARVMGLGGNLVVSHQLTWSQNYLYLDALFGNYPLVHNSALFSDVGYFYPDSDIEAGCAQMALAIKEHDQNLTSYKEKATQKIDSLSPYAIANQDVYARRLSNLSRGRDEMRKRRAQCVR